MMDRFDAMQAFVRVVDMGNFTRAAAALNLPVTTVSAQVRSLEKRLNVKLLQRSTRHVGVTSEGAAFHQQATLLLAQLQGIEDAVMSSNAMPRGRLRVDVTGALGRRILIPALPGFCAAYPEVALEIGCNDRQADLIPESIDCVIRAGPIIDESLVARRLGTSRLIMCASPAYLETYGVPLFDHELAQHALVDFFSTRTGKPMPFGLQHADRTSRITGKRTVSVSDIDACAAAALAGLGIAQLPSFVVDASLREGALVQVLADRPCPQNPIHALYPANRHAAPKLKVFVDWAAALLAGIPALRT